MNDNKYIDEFKLIIILKCLLEKEVKIYPLSKYMTDTLQTNIEIIEEFYKHFKLPFKDSFLIENKELMKDLWPDPYTEIGDFQTVMQLEKPFSDFESAVFEGGHEYYDEIEGIWIHETVSKCCSNISYPYTSKEYVNSCMGIKFKITENDRSKIEPQLNEYIEKYKDGKLEGIEIYNYQKHFDCYIEFLKGKENLYNLNHVEFDPNQFDSSYRFIEFLLLLEKKNYLRIKSIDFNTFLKPIYFETDETGEYATIKSWKATLEIYKTSSEIKALELESNSEISRKNKTALSEESEIINLLLTDLSVVKIGEKLNFGKKVINNKLNLIYEKYNIEGTGNNKGKREELVKKIQSKEIQIT